MPKCVVRSNKKNHIFSAVACANLLVTELKLAVAENGV